MAARKMKVDKDLKKIGEVQAASRTALGLEVRIGLSVGFLLLVFGYVALTQGVSATSLDRRRRGRRRWLYGDDHRRQRRGQQCRPGGRVEGDHHGGRSCHRRRVRGQRCACSPVPTSWPRSPAESSIPRACPVRIFSSRRCSPRFWPRRSGFTSRLISARRFRPRIRSSARFSARGLRRPEPR